MYVPLLKNIFLVSEIGWHQPAAVQAGIVLKYVTYLQLHIGQVGQVEQGRVGRGG